MAERRPREAAGETPGGSAEEAPGEAPARRGQEGLSIRPQTLHFSPQYRRLRDTILRPHLRMTESRYFWERWKPRLGPDAAVLIMEVRDRCNHTPDEGCTVSANELAAACGFSRVTLWRLLQREDVRRFVQVEHNYVYDRRIGKRRRTVSTYHVLMEDPLVEEDEPRLQQLLAQHGAEMDPDQGAFGRGASGQTFVERRAGRAAPSEHAERAAPALPSSPSSADYPNTSSSQRPMFQAETKVVDNPPPTLHSETARGGSISKLQDVLETITKERLGRNGSNGASSPNGQPGDESAPRSVPGTARRRGTDGKPALDVDIWKKYPEIAHYVEEAETLLGDRHSRGFYLASLKRLYPGHMAVWQRALGLAREQQNIRRSRGALFTRLLRTFAAEAGVSL